VVRYEYDPRKAIAMIEDLGFTRGPDGAFRDTSGQRLSVELRASTSRDLGPKAMLAVADDWQRSGVGVDQAPIPNQRASDTPYRATFPGFELIVGTPFDLEGISQLHSTKARVPENNFIGSNYSRYMNPEFDALIDRYFVTVPQGERTQVLGQIIYHISDRLNAMGMVWDPNFAMISNRITGVRPTNAPNATLMWNSHEWDLK
jgi:peptide/nickel transport system substrate-binding protein